VAIGATKMNTKFITIAATIWLILATFAYGLVVNPVSGSQNSYVDRTQDFWITVPEQSLLHIWTDLCDNTNSGWCGGIVDSMLWLYDSNGTLIAANDDSYTDHTGGHSLASTIRVSVPAGNYRVRAGVCCGDPTADRFYGNHYYMISNFEAELAPGTPSATWTPTPQPTPTPTPTPEPTPTPTPTPTPEPTPTPVPDPYLNAPTGLMVTVYTNGNVYLTWNAPEASGTDVERYGVFWTTGESNGWGTPSTETNMGIASNVFVITGGVDQTYTFWVRADNDTLHVYSPISATVSVFVPAPPPPTPSPTPEPTPTPTPEPTPEPTPTPTPEPPTPSPSVAPTPTPEPSVSPSPVPTPTPTPEVTNEPTPNPTATPEPSPEPTATPTEPPAPSPDPSPVPTDTPGPIDPGAAVEAVTEVVGEVAAAAVEAVGEAFAAVGEAVGAAVDTVANLGNDITEEEKEEARTVVGPAVIMTTIAQAAVSAAAARGASSSGGGGFSGGGDGGGKGKGRAGGRRQGAGRSSGPKPQQAKTAQGGQRRGGK
jgi:hypothetical protein